MKSFKKNMFGFAHHALLGIIVVAIIVAVGVKVLAGTHALKSSGGTCVRNTPVVTIENTYQWATWGSWGTPGQKLAYLVRAFNYDQNCGSSNFAVNLSAPSGFTVSAPSTNTPVNSGGDVKLTVYVTSPATIANGDYPITASITRTATGVAGTGFSSKYKVYSTDTTAPTFGVNSPYEGEVLSSKGKGSGSVNVSVNSADDHAVKTIQTYIDGNLVSTTNCDDIAYNCYSTYSWSSHATGAHTAMWKSYDWFGNVSTLSANFSVN